LGIKERKEREKELRRLSILDSAQKLFFELGYDQTSVSKIAEEAELSKGTVYLYFESKEDLLLAVNTRGIETLENYLLNTDSNKKPGIEQIYDLGIAFRKFAIENTEFFQIMNRSESQKLKLDKNSPAYQKKQNKSNDLLRILLKAIETGKNDGSIRSDINPKILAIQMWGSLSGLLNIELNFKQHVSFLKDENIELITKNFFKLLKNAIQTELK
jgi:AcrR family transcriptional regulator